MLLLRLLSLVLCSQVKLSIGFNLPVGSSCNNDNSYATLNNGICKLLTECDEAKRKLKINGYEHGLKRCGFDGFIEIVCCPLNSTIIGAEIAEKECLKIRNSTSPPLVPLIIGGNESSLGEFPHMVLLGYEDGMHRDEYDFQCGGSLISDRYVLTAAHCAEDSKLPNIVRLGVTKRGTNKWNNSTDIRIEEVIKHENYNSSISFYNDVALIRLDRPVSFNNDVIPACLYTKKEIPNESLIVTGWGIRDFPRKILSNTLEKTNLNITPQSLCGPKYKNDTTNFPDGILEEKQICASEPITHADACQGDSGGPLQLLAADNYYHIVGIISYGMQCGIHPGIYTRVTNYLQWIAQHVWPNVGQTNKYKSH